MTGQSGREKSKTIPATPGDGKSQEGIYRSKKAKNH